jgi:radical SAM protein with 4Fe4S-binding SPASM domain
MFRKARRSYPKTYQIEVFAGCDLRCPLCHAGRLELVREHKVLTLDQFKSIFDKIKPYAELLYLHIWGEPTLNKRLVEMIEYVYEQKPECVTNVSTHGNGLSRSYAERLVKSGLKQLIVSIDGVDQATYEKYRVGGRLDEALQFLRDCSDVKLTLGSDILITAQCLETKDTASQRGLFDQMVKFPGIVPVHKPLYIGGYGVDYKKYLASGASVQAPTLESCTALADVVAIQADGRLIPCCLYPEPAERYDLGNILEQSLEELFELPARWEMERRIRSGEAPTRVCENACGRCSEASLMKARREIPVLAQ